MMISFLGIEDQYLLAIDKAVHHTTSISMTNNKLEHYHCSLAKFLQVCWSKAQTEKYFFNDNIFFKKKVTWAWTMGFLLCLQSVLLALYPTHAHSFQVPSLKKSLSFRQRAAAHVCMYKMLTCSIHLVHINHRSLMNHFLACPWPCWECSVCRNQNLWGHLLWVSLWPVSPIQLSLWK